MYSRVTNTADIFGHQSVDDFLHQRDDGIGKVYLRPGNRDGERGGDCRRRVAVATVETTDHGGFRFDESREENYRVESDHGGGRWERSLANIQHRAEGENEESPDGRAGCFLEVVGCDDARGGDEYVGVSLVDEWGLDAGEGVRSNGKFGGISNYFVQSESRHAVVRVDWDRAWRCVETGIS